MRPARQGAAEDCSRDCGRDSRPARRDAPQQDGRPDCSRDCGLAPTVQPARLVAGKHARKAAGANPSRSRLQALLEISSGANPSRLRRRASAWLLRTTCQRWRPAAWLHASATQAQASRATCHSTCLIRKVSSRPEAGIARRPIERAMGVHGPDGMAWAAWVAVGVPRGRVEVAVV